MEIIEVPTAADKWSEWLHVSVDDVLHVPKNPLHSKDNVGDFGEVFNCSSELFDLQSSLASPLIAIQLVRTENTHMNGRKSRYVEANVFMSKDLQEMPPRLIGRTSNVKIFENLVSILNDLVENYPNLAWGPLDAFAALQAQEQVLHKIADEITENLYCPGFGEQVLQYEFLVGTLSEAIKSTLPKLSDADSSQIDFVTSGMFWQCDVLKIWNENQEFFFGQSNKYANVSSFSEFLPQPPEDCCVCMVTPLDGSENYGILSNCRHVFCAECLERCFEQKPQCPMCRQHGQWISRDAFEGLQGLLGAVISEL